jgi:hypothetical protein
MEEIMGMFDFFKSLFTKKGKDTFYEPTTKRAGERKAKIKLAKGETLNPKARRVSAKQIRRGLNKHIRGIKERGWSK